jgi:thiamine pyrophosphokinase
MSDVFCIVGASEVSNSELFVPEGAFVIAADGGFTTLQKAGISPDLIMGDFDSLGEAPKGENVVLSSPEKDDTDTMLAVKKSLEMGAKTLLIYGGLGGRFDHSLGNIQTLAYIARAGSRGYLIGGGTICTAIMNGGLAFPPDMKGILSVFSLSGVSLGVNLKGLKYPLSDHSLYFYEPLGVSNEFIGTKAFVSVDDGVLALVWSDSRFDAEKYLPF